MAARVYFPNLIGWPLCIYYKSTNSKPISMKFGLLKSQVIVENLNYLTILSILKKFCCR